MPQIILLSTFLIAFFILKILHKEYRFALSGRIAMAAMLVTTAVAHFVFAKGMTLMLPDFIPYKFELVYFTGVIEMMAAIGLLLPKYRKLTAWLLIVFFVVLLPSNIYATMKHVNLQTATFDGNGPGYLWFRIPLQIFFIGWVYFSALKLSAAGSDH